MLKRALTTLIAILIFCSIPLLGACSDSGADSNTTPSANNGTATGVHNATAPNVHNATNGQAPAGELTQHANATVGAQNATDPMSLALQAITMSQGEKGLEIWRLKAEWASMEQEDGKIIVREPRLTYFMPPPDEGELHVTSDTGTVDQKEQILRFEGNVVVTQETSRVTGHVLVYNGTAKTMTFPEGGVFSGDGMSGNAPIVRWHMDAQQIDAEGGVTIDFAGKPEPAASESGKPESVAPASPTAPAK